VFLYSEVNLRVHAELQSGFDCVALQI
jgi:hypothetical protein